MISNIGTGAELVLDARAAGRFSGTAPEPRAGMRGGHIPGSASLPFNEVLNPDQTFAPPAALRRNAYNFNSLCKNKKQIGRIKKQKLKKGKLSLSLSQFAHFFFFAF